MNSPNDIVGVSVYKINVDKYNFLVLYSSGLSRLYHNLNSEQLKVRLNELPETILEILAVAAINNTEVCWIMSDFANKLSFFRYVRAIEEDKIAQSNTYEIDTSVVKIQSIRVSSDDLLINIHYSTETYVHALVMSTAQLSQFILTLTPSVRQAYLEDLFTRRYYSE